jgi:hypothetical protein
MVVGGSSLTHPCRLFCILRLGTAVRNTFDKITTLRVRSDISERVRAIANQEGNTEAAVLRRALTTGLNVIVSQQAASALANGPMLGQADA